MILNGGPEGLEIGDALKLLISIQRKRKIGGGMGGDDFCQCFQAREISIRLAVDFDFEMPQAVGGDAVSECLGKLIGNGLIFGDVRG